jgi:hypothetical protein
MKRNPFIAGSWVRGDNFFGRSDVLREVLEGERNALWIVGARRIGKTSLLKELELRSQSGTQSPFAPLYWDIQGSADARGLADSLLESVEDSESFRRATDIGVEDLEGLSVHEMLTTAVRKTVRSGWRLLLLVEEAEELLNLARTDVALVARLRRVFQKGPELRTVITSTRRLARIDEQPGFSTSPFLHGFTPPLYLTPLEPDDARALLARGGFAPAEVEEIVTRTAAHPFLVQLIASRLFENHDLALTLDQVASDEMVSNFFSVDHQTLEPAERVLLEEAARLGPATRAALGEASGLSEDAAEPVIFGLRMMGYLALEGERYRVGNWFFERWLKRVAAARPAATPA